MNKSIIKPVSADIISAAVEKIKGEFENFKGGNKEKAVSSYVSNIIQDFCRQDERFADVVYRYKRTLSDCAAEIMKGVGNHISDIDVYRSAVKFYFPNSEIEMTMKINITGDAPDEAEILKETEKPKKKETKKPKKTENKPKDKSSDKKTAQKKAPEKPKKQEPEFIQLTLF